MDIDKILEEEIHPRAKDYACGREMAMAFKPLTVDDVYDAYMAGAETALRTNVDGYIRWE